MIEYICWMDCRVGKIADDVIVFHYHSCFNYGTLGIKSV